MEDRFFFNPYGFPGTFNTNIPPNMMPPPNVAQGVPTNSKITPKEFYENQYYYYRYLNEAINYQMKYQEFSERMNKNFNSSQNKSV